MKGGGEKKIEEILPFLEEKKGAPPPNRICRGKGENSGWGEE